MSDIAKWALLVTAVLALIVIVLTMPFAKFLPTGAQQITVYIDEIVTLCSGFFYTARSLINIFLFESARSVLSGLIVYLFAKWIITISVKITTWIFHFIFK